MLEKPLTPMGVRAASAPPVIHHVGVAVLDRFEGVADRVSCGAAQAVATASWAAVRSGWRSVRSRR